jgi:hypothetical protein
MIFEKTLVKFGLKCTFCSLLASLLFGCGKKVNVVGDGTTDGNNGDQRLLKPGTINIKAQKLIGQPGQKVSYTFEDLAEVTIPGQIFVTEGNAANQKAYAYINEYNGDYHFYCMYQGQSSTQTPDTPMEIELGMTYQLVDCYDHDDDPLGVGAGLEYFIDKDHKISIVIEGSDPRVDTSTVTSFDVEWK